MFSDRAGPVGVRGQFWTGTMSPPLPLLPLLLLPLLRCAASDAYCSDAFRSGPEDFVLDSEDAVMGGAVLLDSAYVPSADACQRACCLRERCNLALLELRESDAAGARNHTCVLFDCVYRNRFVCRFVNRDGFRSFIRTSVSLRHLRGPPRGGESRSQSEPTRTGPVRRARVRAQGSGGLGVRGPGPGAGCPSS